MPWLRLITTNDFYGSWFRRPASYGALPGAAALRATVDRMRAEVPAALWIDCGDFAQGGPLAPVSAGALGFVAARGLGIDVATVGNHELDWGADHFRRWIGEAGFPVVCANADLGPPAATVIAAGALAVGVVGLTHPALAGFHPWFAAGQPDSAASARQQAAALRRDGADVVVVALHDGVDWAWSPDGRLSPRPERLAGVLAGMRGAVDAVLGGHTLGRWLGELGGVPFVQPWAFGAEVGVVDLFRDRPAEVSAAAVSGNADWHGVGAALHAALAAEVVGELAAPLVDAPMGDRSLPEAVADGMLRVTGADLALVSPAEFQTMQPPIDGAFAFLPAGPVSEADLLRAVPWADDAVFVADLSPAQVAALADRMGQPASWGSFGPPAVARRGEARAGVVAVARWQARRFGEVAGRAVDWRPAGGQRDALRAFAAR